MTGRIDLRLLARMVLALVAGVLVNAVLVTFVAVAAIPLYAPAFRDGFVESVVATYSVGLPRVASGTGVAAILGVSLVLTAYHGVRAVRSGPREVEDLADAVRDDDLERRVRRLSQVAGVTTPSVWVVSSDEPNCFTVGRSGRAALVVTDRLLETLDDDQLDAVLAHELAHVDSHDVSVMTVYLGQMRWAITAINGAVVVGWFGLVSLGMLAASVVDALVGGGTMPGVPTMALGVVSLYSYLAVYSLVVVGFLVATSWVPRQLSQHREYVADRTAAEITGDPAALASALDRLADADARPDRDLRSVGARALHLHSTDEVVPGGVLAVGGRLYDLWWDHDDLPLPTERAVDLLTDSHPPVEDRIGRLRGRAWAMETT